MKADHLTLRLPAELTRALDRWARDHGLPKSQVVRQAMARYLLPPEPADLPRRLTARDLARRWPALPRLTPAEATDLAADVAASRRALPPVHPPWE